MDSAKVKSELKTSKGAEIIRSYTPKLSRIFRDANLPVEKVALVQRPNQRNEVPATPVQAKSQRWGQVECPAQFLPGEDSFQYQSISKNHMCSASVSERMHDPIVLKSGRSLQQPNDDQRKDLNSTETLLTEEVKQLRSQVTLCGYVTDKQIILFPFPEIQDDTISGVSIGDTSRGAIPSKNSSG